MVDSRGIWKIDLEPKNCGLCVLDPWRLWEGDFWRGIDFPGPWKVRILRSCVVELRVLQNPPATEFYFWLLKGGYFRVDQYGLAYLQISRPCDKLVNIIFPTEQLPLPYSLWRKWLERVTNANDWQTIDCRVLAWSNIGTTSWLQEIR